ncbi:MAG: hypothetical protein WBE86_07275 [Candidatus Acidiferrales bacterium]
MSNANALWKTISLMAFSALGGCVSTAYFIGHSTVTRSDVSRMIVTESPYAQDKNDIYNRLEELRTGQQEENQKLDAVIEALSARRP